MNRILLIEENAFIREALRQILQSRFPFLIIEEVYCYEDCINEMGDFKPDILFLGIRDYESSGLAELLKLRELFPAAVIILFTDYETDEYRRKGFLTGANYIISKDLWTGNEILNLMKTILLTGSGGKIPDLKEQDGEPDFLYRPIERRHRGRSNKKAEVEFLEKHPDRRKQKHA